MKITFIVFLTILLLVFLATTKSNWKINKDQNEQNDTTLLSKTSEMLNEDKFWGIIDKSLKHANNQREQEDVLIEEVEKLTPNEMIGFSLHTDKLLFETYNSNMWCAAYIMNGGCSDDGFEYFRYWLISRGRSTYENAKRDPDILIKEVTNDKEYEFEGFGYVAINAFKKITGKDIYEYMDREKFIASIGEHPAIVFTWKEDEPESMRKICPVLFNKLWGK